MRVGVEIALRIARRARALAQHVEGTQRKVRLRAPARQRLLIVSPTMKACAISCIDWRNAARTTGATSGAVRLAAVNSPDSSAVTFGSSRPPAPSNTKPVRSSTAMSAGARSGAWWPGARRSAGRRAWDRACAGSASASPISALPCALSSGNCSSICSTSGRARYPRGPPPPSAQPARSRQSGQAHRGKVRHDLGARGLRAQRRHAPLAQRRQGACARFPHSSLSSAEFLLGISFLLPSFTSPPPPSIHPAPALSPPPTV